MKNRLPLFTALCSLLWSLQSFAIVDFEDVTTEGAAISNQYTASDGITFALADGTSPIIARVGSPAFAFSSDFGDGDDTPSAANNGQGVGSSFLVDSAMDNLGSPPSALVVTYASPAQTASGVILDIDQSEAWVITSYDSSGNLLTGVELDANSPNHGDGLATAWLISHATADIAKVVISYNGATSTGIGYAWDNFSSRQPTVGVNKDFTNTTGQNANDIEILLRGIHTVVQHYDGYPANHFATFDVTTEPPGNTRLHWSNPNNPVAPNQTAHVGFLIPGTQPNVIKGVFWTLDGTVTGCARQVNTPHAAWGVNPGNLVTYVNDALECESVPLYAGDATIRWYTSEVPLEDLNLVALGYTTPLRTDTISAPPVFLNPGSSADVSIPAAPANAQFAVMSFKVGTDSSLATGNETDDFVQTQIPEPGRLLQLGSGVLLLWILYRRRSARRMRA